MSATEDMISDFAESRQNCGNQGAGWVTVRNWRKRAAAIKKGKSCDGCGDGASPTSGAGPEFFGSMWTAKALVQLKISTRFLGYARPKLGNVFVSPIRDFGSCLIGY
jgi:hypothetical protein